AASWSAVKPSGAVAVTGACCASSSRTALASLFLAASTKRKSAVAAARAPDIKTSPVATLRSFIGIRASGHQYITATSGSPRAPLLLWAAVAIMTAIAHILDFHND